jgi:hypothetical protein
MFADRRLFTNEQVNKIAPTSDFICIEKQHGINEIGSADAGAKHAINQFKTKKPGMSCLVYLNSAYAYPFISQSKAFEWREAIHKPENARYRSFLIIDPETGDLAYRESDHCHLLDVLNPDLREWWVKTAADLVRDANGDGLFVDQMHGFSWLREDRAAEVAESQALMMRMTKDAIGPDKILLLNNADHIPELFETGDAFMFEHYSSNLLTKEKILEDWSQMKKIADAGKISVWRIGVEHDDLSIRARAEGENLTGEFFERVSKERIDYYLAAFLIGAREHSYFQYGWGWNVWTGPLVEYPELSRPLGRPQGDYIRVAPDGWIFTRQFEHATVTVDLEKQEGQIDHR